MKLLISMICILFCCTSCISGTVAGYGMFEIDPGVRVYQSEDSTIINITHKKGEPPPDYESIALIIKQVCK